MKGLRKPDFHILQTVKELGTICVAMKFESMIPEDFAERE